MKTLYEIVAHMHERGPIYRPVIPIEDPRVLRRVVETMHRELKWYADEENKGMDSIEWYIEQARKELESEAKCERS